MSQALRQRRSRAARALASHERRAQLGWDDLAAWPDWADDTAAVPELATRVGAIWRAAALRSCIHGPTLKRLQHSLGEETLQALANVETPAADRRAADTAPLPAAEQIEAWLQAQGAEVMLAALPSPLLRLALREQLWPKVLQQLPSPDTAAASRALERALALPLARAAA